MFNLILFYFAWSVCFVGLGIGLIKLLGLESDFKPALYCGLGFSIYTLLGGFLQLTNHTLSLDIILMTLFLGLSLSTFHYLKSFKANAASLRIRNNIWPILFIGLALFLKLILANDLGFGFNAFDDLLAYIPFAKMQLAMGEVVDPFSFRRLAAYGGQTIFHSTHLIFFDERSLIFFEKAYVPALLIWCLISYFRALEVEKLYKIILPVLISIYIVWADCPRINLASQMTGAFIFLNLIIFLESHKNEKLLVWSSILQLACFAAAMCALRANYILGVGFVILIYLLSAKVLNKAKMIWAVKTAALILTLLLPFMWGLYKSSNTIFFPIWTGNFNTNFGSLVSDRGQNQDVFSSLVSAVLYSEFLLIFLLFAVLHDRKKVNTFMIATSLTGLFSMFAIAYSYRSLESYVDIYRYAYPFIIIPKLFLLFKVNLDFDINGFHKVWKLKSLQCAVGVFLLVMVLEIFINFKDSIVFSKKEILTGELFLWRDPFADFRSQYNKLQTHFTKGDKVFSALEMPFLFDYNANKIWHLDIPGNASPMNSMPSFDDEKKVDEYLKNLGIKYLVFVDPKTANHLYSEKFWDVEKKLNRYKHYHQDWMFWMQKYFIYIRAKMHDHRTVKIEPNFYILKF